MAITISGDVPNFSAATITTGTVTTLTTTTISDGTNSTSSTNCIQGSAKAWVNFNASSGSSCVINGSYNVSSVTYVNVGQYQVNFTNALADANYSAQYNANYDGSAGAYNTYASVFGQTSTYAQLQTGYSLTRNAKLNSFVAFR